MSILLDGLQLPDELIWTDEFEWTTVREVAKRTIQGKYIAYSSLIPSEAGRKITLTSDNSWIRRSTVITLRDWADIIDKKMSLSLHDGTTRLVSFRHWEPPVLGIEPLVFTAFPDNDTLYKLTLRLVVV